MYSSLVTLFMGLNLYWVFQVLSFSFLGFVIWGYESRHLYARMDVLVLLNYYYQLQNEKVD